MDADARKEIEDPLFGYQPHVAVQFPLLRHSAPPKRLPHELDDSENARSTKYDFYDGSHFCPNVCVWSDNTE